MTPCSWTRTLQQARLVQCDVAFLRAGSILSREAYSGDWRTTLEDGIGSIGSTEHISDLTTSGAFQLQSLRLSSLNACN